MSRYSLVFVICLLGISLSACTTAKISGRGAKPIALNQLDQTEPVESFEKQQFRMFDYTGAIDVSEVLEGELSQSEADAMTNTTVEIGANVGTFLVNTITFGLARAHTVTVNGDLVKVQNVAMGSVTTPSLESIEVDRVKPSVFNPEPQKAGSGR